MHGQDKNRTRRLRNIITLFSLTAIILSVSTYAWFVGLQTVNVTAFEVKIATAESLLLSLDGETWSDTVSISKETLDDVSYEGHQNTWGGDKGLTPVSTIGEMDKTISKLKLYEKGSLTTTPGGYRLMASKVENTVDGELDGYVAFDLFIRNISGRQYIKGYNTLDEEAIYLTTNSEVKVSEAGTPNTGIENSVRVAFAQIGRVRGDVLNMPAAAITGITCNDSNGLDNQADTDDDVTGICGPSETGKPATIWEPNDMFHEDSAINYYTTSCKKRKTTEDGADLTKVTAYETDACEPLAAGTYYPTYAVRRPIASTDRVDVYDGAEYNGYTATSDPEGTVKAIEKVVTFTDTMKMKKGVQRDSIMTLAPNSITKVRVYIYLEGQDIDNYDFASIGKQITVNFGFTKQRFEPDDIQYSGPPIISLKGGEKIVVTTGTKYVEPGVVGYALNAEGVSEQKTVTSNAATVLDLAEGTEIIGAEPGTYTITYTLTDDIAQNPQTSTVTRIVEVVEAPEEGD
jgi:hypothetical protein